MKACAMNWIRQLKSRTHYGLAQVLRKLVQSRTISALCRLDDRSLAAIGVPRRRIGEYARDVARRTVVVPAKPPSDRAGLLTRISSWRRRQAAMRELALFAHRLLRDIGIEPGQIGDVVDAMLSRRRHPDSSHLIGQPL